MNHFTRSYSRLAGFATLLALIVVMLGAYTRLSDAGLGCPDWPGCYGHLTVPHTSEAVSQAQRNFPGQTVEAAKAWKEMVHRYFAGSLGVLIAILALWGICRRFRYANQPVVLPIILVALVLFQAVLGMWTVTWKVLPLIVSAHLLGGIIITALLWYVTLSSRPNTTPRAFGNPYKPWTILALAVVLLQLFLGAWTSTNYAALACTDFPFCHGLLFPPMDIHAGFNLLQPIGVNYEGGVLDSAARVAIQMMHRYGALLTALVVGLLALCVLFGRSGKGLRGAAAALLLILIAQILLGMVNVLWSLPLAIAVAHNGVAALLLLAVVTLLYQTNHPPTIS